MNNNLLVYARDGGAETVPVLQMWDPVRYRFGIRGRGPYFLSVSFSTVQWSFSVGILQNIVAVCYVP